MWTVLMRATQLLGVKAGIYTLGSLVLETGFLPIYCILMRSHNKKTFNISSNELTNSKLLLSTFYV
jgi:hypothetical protein